MNETLKWICFDMFSWSKNNTETYFVRSEKELAGLKQNVKELNLDRVVTIVGHDVTIHRDIFSLPVFRRLEG